MSVAGVLASTDLASASTATAQDSAGQTSMSETRDPVVVQLKSGTRLRGVITEDGGDGITLLVDGLDEIRIPQSQIVAADLPEDTPLSPDDDAIEAPPPPGLFGSGILEGFDKGVGLGFSGTTGETDEFSLSASAYARYQDAGKRWNFSLLYATGEVDGETTKDEGYAKLRRDWLLQGDPTFFWAEGRADYNDFQAYRFRIGGFAGVGYTFFGDEETASYYDRSDFSLLGRVGAGGSYEAGDVDDFEPELVFAAEAAWDIKDNQKLLASHSFFPEIEDYDEGRHVSEVSYSIAIDQGLGLNLRFGIYNEYLTETEDDSPNNSLNYFGQIAYEF